MKMDTLVRRMDGTGLLTVEKTGNEKPLRVRKEIAGRNLRVLNMAARDLFNDS